MLSLTKSGKSLVSDKEKQIYVKGNRSFDYRNTCILLHVSVITRHSYLLLDKKKYCVCYGYRNLNINDQFRYITVLYEVPIYYSSRDSLCSIDICFLTKT